MALVVQWLRLHALNAGSTGVVPNWGSKIPLAKWCNQKIYMYVNCSLPFGIRARKEIKMGKTPVDKVRSETCQEGRQPKDKNKELWASLVAQR